MISVVWIYDTFENNFEIGHKLEKKYFNKFSISFPMCQRFSHYSDFMHHFGVTKLATSSIRVNIAKSATGSDNNQKTLQAR